MEAADGSEGVRLGMPPGGREGEWNAGSGGVVGWGRGRQWAWWYGYGGECVVRENGWGKGRLGEIWADMIKCDGSGGGWWVGCVLQICADMRYADTHCI